MLGDLILPTGRYDEFGRTCREVCLLIGGSRRSRTGLSTLKARATANLSFSAKRNGHDMDTTRHRHRYSSVLVPQILPLGISQVGVVRLPVRSIQYCNSLHKQTRIFKALIGYIRGYLRFWPKGH